MVSIVRAKIIVVPALVGGGIIAHEVAERFITTELGYVRNGTDGRDLVRHTCIRLICSSCQVSIETDLTKLEEMRKVRIYENAG